MKNRILDFGTYPTHKFFIRMNIDTTVKTTAFFFFHKQVVSQYLHSTISTNSTHLR